MFSIKTITNAFFLYGFWVFCIVNHDIIIVLKTIFIWFFPISGCYCNLLRMWPSRIFAKPDLFPLQKFFRVLINNKKDCTQNLQQQINLKWRVKSYLIKIICEWNCEIVISIWTHSGWQQQSDQWNIAVI